MRLGMSAAASRQKRSRSVCHCAAREADCPGSEPASPGDQISGLFIILYRWIFVRSYFGVHGCISMNSHCYTVAMDLGVCQLRNFSISFLSSVLGKENSSVKVDNR